MARGSEPTGKLCENSDMESQAKAVPAMRSAAVPIMGAIIAVLLVALLVTALWGADVFDDDDDSDAAAAAPEDVAPGRFAVGLGSESSGPQGWLKKWRRHFGGWRRRTSQVGPRPYYLVDIMPEGPLKEQLQECTSMPLRKNDWSIGHRGAPLMFPEHTVESYRAAARQGAGIIECDVTFTADHELVCRHAECDLHTTTNILETPLAAKCAIPFTPATETEDAKAKCCASALTLAEFRTLRGKMDGANAKGKTVAEYMDGTPKMRTDLYSTNGTLITHEESIALFKSLGVKMTPELKGPDSTMPAAFTRTEFIQKAVAQYTAADVPACDVFLQSFLWADIEELLTTPFASQTTFLDSRTYNDPEFVATSADFEAKYATGLRYVAPAVNGLVALDSNNNMIETNYSKLSKAAGLKIISWTAERSDWYYNSVSTYVTSDKYYMHFIDFLAQTVQVTGLFSDWPATTTFYANCFRL